MYFKYHGPLTAGKRRDKRDVYFLSTMFCDEKEDISRRGAEGALETVQKPKIITDYNNNMSPFCFICSSKSTEGKCFR